MSALVSSDITRFIAQYHYGVISEQLGLVAIALATALLIERELIRAVEPDTHREIRIQSINAVVLPLLIALVLIVVLRFLELLG
jgi:Na+-translocating ferredoxin:NAD+ oxidoreductase RnfD subunit